MAKKFPVDEFDLAPLSGGRHRLRRNAANGFLEFVSITVATGLVLTAGFYAFNSFSPSGVLPNNNPSSSATTAVVISRGGGVGVSVLDASGSQGLASSVAHKLLDAGWNVFAAADLVDPKNKKATQKVTVLYVQSEDLRSKAEALKGDLGSFDIVVSATYLDPITVVLGKDYQP
jgi:hypothetical protein